MGALDVFKRSGDFGYRFVGVVFNETVFLAVGVSI